MKKIKLPSILLVLAILVMQVISVPSHTFAGSADEHNLQTAILPNVGIQMRDLVQGVSLNGGEGAPVGNPFSFISPVIAQSLGDHDFKDGHKVSWFSIGDGLSFEFKGNDGQQFMMNIDISGSTKKMDAGDAATVASYLTALTVNLPNIVTKLFQSEYGNNIPEKNFEEKVFRYMSMVYAAVEQLNGDMKEKFNSDAFGYRVLLGDTSKDPEKLVLKTQTGENIWKNEKNPFMVFGSDAFLASFNTWLNNLLAEEISLEDKMNLDEKLDKEKGLFHVPSEIIRKLNSQVNLDLELPEDGYQTEDVERVIVMMDFGQPYMTKGSDFEKAKDFLYQLKESRFIKEIRITDRLVVTFEPNHIHVANDFLIAMKNEFLEMAGGVSAGKVARSSYKDSEGNQKSTIYGRAVVEAAMLTTLSLISSETIFIHQKAASKLIHEYFQNPDSEFTLTRFKTKHAIAYALVKNGYTGADDEISLQKIAVKHPTMKEQIELLDKIPANQPRQIELNFELSDSIRMTGKFYMFRMEDTEKKNGVTVILEVKEGESNQDLEKLRLEIEEEFFFQLLRNEVEMGTKGNNILALRSSGLKKSLIETVGGPGAVFAAMSYRLKNINFDNMFFNARTYEQIATEAVKNREKELMGIVDDVDRDGFNLNFFIAA